MTECLNIESNQMSYDQEKQKSTKINNAEVTILIQKGTHLQHLEYIAQNHWHHY